MTDEEGTYQAIKAITNKYEGTGTAASFDKLSEEYIKKLIGAIVGFSIEVERFDNVFKLSQNRDEESYYNIINKLENQDASGKFIADEMKKRTNTLFPK